jgi:hypothetical protein
MLVESVLGGVAAVLGRHRRQHFSAGLKSPLFRSQIMNDEKPVLGISDRDEARTRLARQIGRILAHAWLRDRSTVQPDAVSSDVGSDPDAGHEDGPAHNDSLPS